MATEEERLPRPFVAIATKGRASEVYRLLDYLNAQTLPPAGIVVMGAGPDDIAGLQAHELVKSGACALEMAEKPGLPRQRNRCLQHLDEHFAFGGEDTFVAFFDDDFRPGADWLMNAARAFAADSQLAGLTGWVLGDGVRIGGITEDNASKFLTGDLDPMVHWTDIPDQTEMSSAYGCNMAFRGSVATTCKFNEELPLYAWQEDRDYTGQVRRIGDVRLLRACQGVHLGVQSARQNGMRLGYSQVANPVHILCRGNMSYGAGLKLISRNLAGNILYSLIGKRNQDYPGRLRGNMTAFFDLLRGKCHPERILDFKP
ncbi:glycosyltransferase family 2 protein [Henriciella aquimarina]|uniref:glycosyltransferase family 2 protein n=1 Tax=Henriciella aquimarina TaxID=545261 RepID=UPI00117AF30E|nr:glycosyltransferase family A protein [Henriciella aquimarina]